MYRWTANGEIFNSEELLIKHIRSLGDSRFNIASDEFLLNESYSFAEYEVMEKTIEIIFSNN